MSDGIGAIRTTRVGPSVHVSTSGTVGQITAPTTRTTRAWARGGRWLAAKTPPPPPPVWHRWRLSEAT